MNQLDVIAPCPLCGGLKDLKGRIPRQATFTNGGFVW